MMKMSILIFMIIILNHLHFLCIFTEHMCFWRMKENEDEDRNKHDLIFFLQATQGFPDPFYFPEIKDVQLQPKNYQNFLAFLFAIMEIDKNPDLLQNISIAFHIKAMINDEFLSFHNALTKGAREGEYLPNYICQPPITVTAMLTESTWATSINVAAFTQLFKIPQLTYGCFHSLQNAPDQFPYLYQMASKDTFLAAAMVSLLDHFSWNWVGLAILDDDQGVQFLSELRKELQRKECCLAFVNMIPVETQLYLQRAEIYYNQIETSSANVVIIYGCIDSTLSLSLRRWEYLGTRRLWVTTSQWDDSISKREFILDLFHGSLIFSHQHGEISGFKSFLQTMNSSRHPRNNDPAKLWWRYFNCTFSKTYSSMLKNCSSSNCLEWLQWHSPEFLMNDQSYNVYNAVYAVAHTLHEMLLQHVDMYNESGLVYLSSQLYPFLRNIQFTNPFGDPVNMNQKHSLGKGYDIFNIWNSPQGLGLKVKIGRFSPHDEQLFLSQYMTEWGTGMSETLASVCSMSCAPGFKKTPQEGKATCCFDCVACPENEISNETGLSQCIKCPDHQYASIEQIFCLDKAVSFLAYEDPLGMALACLAICFSVFTLTVLGVFVQHHNTPIVKANNRTLSYVLLISLHFCFLSSLLFIGHPNLATCILQQTTFGALFTVAVSTVLAKTMTVLLAFKLTAPGRRIRQLMVTGAPNLIIPFCTLIQLTICGVWLGSSPPFIETDAHSEPGHILIVCNKGSITAFYCSLGFLSMLALGSFSVAFKARNLPDTFNEAKFLTFSMLVFCTVWVTFLPVYQGSKGKVMAAVEVFSILASGAGILLCIFVPKFFIILFRPEKILDKTVGLKCISNLILFPEI